VKSVLILCTGNSCRSQIAEGIMKNLHPDYEIYSAGTKPAERVHPLAIKALSEIGIDISQNYPKKVDDFINKSFDLVLTVCDSANETCPVFTGKVKKRLHHSFEDPAAAVGNEEEIFGVFRKVRDEIYQFLQKLEI